MKQSLRTAMLLTVSGIAASAAPAENPFRLAAFDTSSFPKVFSILDVRPEAAGSQTLNANDFQLLEDDKGTALASRTLKFRDTGAGLALIVAIDVSPSMEGRPIDAIRQGLAQLVSRKRDVDRITVLTFAGDIRWETRWNVSSAAMQEAFRNLRTRGNQTHLYDAVDQAMSELAVQTREDSTLPSRTGILVLSDGHDEGSRASLNQVAARVRGSRVRLDAVGLAHTPFWLRSLQLLANAGFGGVRNASSPEQLTQMLGQGIDSLLDMPAVEFKSRNVEADGKSHRLGVDYLPSHWRDQIAVTVPQASFVKDWRFWVAIGAGILLFRITNNLVRRRTPQVVADSRPEVSPAPVPPPPRPAFARTETQVETALDSRRVPSSSRIPTAVEQQSSSPPPRPASVPIFQESLARETLAQEAQDPAPARIATVLAPQSSNGNAAFHTLVAVSGPFASQCFPVSGEEFWIGSSSNNHLCLGADPAVSGNHACIRREGRFQRLYDNGSLNNTIVNGRPIGREVALLQAGDRIRIGQSEFVLEP